MFQLAQVTFKKNSSYTMTKKYFSTDTVYRVLISNRVEYIKKYNKSLQVPLIFIAVVM